MKRFENSIHNTVMDFSSKLLRILFHPIGTGFFILLALYYFFYPVDSFSTALLEFVIGIFFKCVTFLLIYRVLALYHSDKQ
jgi:predicted membrane channel-forming protein YqfA (hemolysin III family)